MFLLFLYLFPFRNLFSLFLFYFLSVSLSFFSSFVLKNTKRIHFFYFSIFLLFWALFYIILPFCYSISLCIFSTASNKFKHSNTNHSLVPQHPSLNRFTIIIPSPKFLHTLQSNTTYIRHHRSTPIINTTNTKTSPRLVPPLGNPHSHHISLTNYTNLHNCHNQQPLYQPTTNLINHQ